MQTNTGSVSIDFNSIYCKTNLDWEVQFQASTESVKDFRDKIYEMSPE